MDVQSVLDHVSWAMSMFSRHFHGISMEKPRIHRKIRHVHGSSKAGLFTLFTGCLDSLEVHGGLERMTEFIYLKKKQIVNFQFKIQIRV